MSKAIEDAASPEEFIQALRRQADRCNEDCGELASAWQDRSAGSFWKEAGKRLSKLADQLERYA